MSNNQQHIDRIIREKFENFNPQPPDFIWENIEANLNGESTIFTSSKLKTVAIFAVSAIIIILLGWLLLGNKYFLHPNTLNKEIVNQKQEKLQNTSTTKHITETGTSSPQTGNNQIETTKKTPVNNTKHQNTKNTNVIAATSTHKQQTAFKYTAKKDFELLITENNHKTVVPTLGALLISGNNIFTVAPPRIITPKVSFNNNNDNLEKGLSKWKTGLIISPEFSITVPDSMEVLHSYSIGVETQYTLSNKTFIRFGLSTTYARDKGYTSVNFKSWDYLGSYDDVYDVTFDTSSGVPVPIYHTHKVDVYDSIQHFDISETTYKYIYLQLPVLIGYNINTGSKLNWYVYGGPVVNAMIYKYKTAPQLSDNSTLLNYNADLPQRNKLVYQFWFGLGFEYALNNKFSITLEPNYRYYFNPVYKNYYKSQPLSAVSLRLGFFIKL